MTTAQKLDLDALTLTKGGHGSLSDGACIMEAVSLIAGEPWGDHPECVSPTIGAFLRSWNDGLDDEPRQRLKPYATKVVGTNTGPADEQIRGALAMDWLVRVHTPAWLELAGLKDEAAELRALPEITPGELSVAVQATLEKARASARSRAAAAWPPRGPPRGTPDMKLLARPCGRPSSSSPTALLIFSIG